MKNSSRLLIAIFTGALLAALVSACGSGRSTVVSSSTPSVYDAHSVAFSGTTPFAWGDNAFGQLGDGDKQGNSKTVPVQVSPGAIGTAVVTGISAGGTHTLAFKNNSSAYAWGNNGDGQLGNNSTTASTTPVQVNMTVPNTTTIGPLSQIVAVSAGGYHNLAIKSDGTLWAWGRNLNGQLGINSTTGSSTALNVKDSTGSAPLAGVTKIAAGGYHSLAIVNPGTGPATATAYAWGYNRFGQLGQQPVFGVYSTNSDRWLPQTVKKTDGTTLSNLVDISAGGNHSLFVLSDGTVWACGYNFLGQLGVGDITDRNLGVVQITTDANGSPFTGVIMVAAGLDHSLALKSDGTVWAWGYNFYGEIGNGATLSTNTLVLTPMQVKKSDGTYLTNVTKIIALGNHNLALTSTGQLYAWGENTFGQLGVGQNDTNNRNLATPVTITNPDLYRP